MGEGVALASGLASVLASPFCVLGFPKGQNSSVSSKSFVQSMPSSHWLALVGSGPSTPAHVYVVQVHLLPALLLSALSVFTTQRL